MRHPRARSKSLHLLLVTFLILDPFLRAMPARASHLSTPEVHNASGGGAGAGIAVNPNTGDASYAIPIALPPGTAGMQPQLALAYDSNDRSSSWAGVGWSVPVASIRRSLRGGTPLYTSTYNGTGDEFELAGERLVFVSTQSGESTYKTERESFLEIRHNNTTNEWTVTRPDGHRLYFGTTAAGRIAIGLGPFEWLLEREDDPLGNAIDYTYYQEGGVAYLQEVQYGAAPKRVVRFERETNPRPDIPVTYLAGFEQLLTRRLDHITVQTVSGASPAAANIIRRYDLAYAEGASGQSPDSGRSLLHSVTLFGVGAGGTGLKTKFTYRQSTAGTTTGWATSWSSWPVTGGSFSFVTPGTRIIDVNGDGLQDVLTFPSGGNRKIFLNNRAGFTATHDYPYPFYAVGQPVTFAYPDNSETADLNGDGRADFFTRYLIAPGFTFYEKANWKASTPGGWSNVAPISSDLHLALSAGVDENSSPIPPTAALADLDGDSAPDIAVRGDFQIGLASPPYCGERRRSEYIYQNNGDMTFTPGGYTDSGTPPGCTSGTSRLGATHLVTASGYTPPLVALAFAGSITASTPSHLQYIDLNGDGLADVVWTDATVRHAYLNYGNGVFGDRDDWQPPVDLVGLGVAFADLNGDGQVDTLRAKAGTARETWLGDGDSEGGTETTWVLSSSWALPVDLFDVYGAATNVRLIDANGDGMLDLTNGTQVRLNRGATPDLLVSVEAPFGAKITIAWKNSTASVDTTLSAFPNSDAADVGFMPFIKPVVASLELDDRKGHIGRREYTYFEGVFDPAEREFRGFERTTEVVGTATTPGVLASEDHRILTEFHQDDVKAGLLKKTSISDGAWVDVLGTLYWVLEQERTTTLTYGTAAHDLRLPVCTVELQIEDFVSRRIGVRAVYDSKGNTTQIDALGLVADDVCTDSGGEPIRSTQIDYATPSARVRDASKRVRLFAGASLLRDTHLYYDYSTTSGTVTNGLLTQIEQVNLTTPSASATTKLFYDAAGRLTSVKSPRESAGEIPAGHGTRLMVYGAGGLPDLVSQTESEPFWLVGGVQRLTSTTSYSPDGTCATAMPAMAGLPAVVEDPNGTQSVICYDVYGRPLSSAVRDSGGAEVARTSFSYSDTTAWPTSGASVTVTQEVTAATTRSATSSLDGLGRTFLTVADGPTTAVHQSTTYDALGRAASASLPGNGAPGALSTFVYDGLGRELTRTTPGATAAVTRYTLEGNNFRVDSLAPDNNGTYSAASETRYLSDAFGDTVEVREMTGSAASPVLYATTTYTHDAAGLMKEIRDTNGNKTTFTYDGLGRRIALADPDTGAWIYGYDRNGSLTLQDGPRAADTLTFQYDLLGRLKVLTRAGASKTLRYDLATGGLGRFWKEVEGSEGYGVVVYDALGRPTAEQAVAAGKQFDFSTTYNQIGDVLTRTLPSNLPTGRVITYARNARGYATGVTTNGGAETYASNITWHFSGQLAAWTAGNGVVTNYGYNATTLLPSSFSAGTAESITAYAYKPDYRLASTTGTTTSTFNYDDLGRLKDATGPYNPGTSTPYAQATLHYGYDVIGNLTCMDASAAPSGTTCTNGKRFVYPTANTTTPPARPHGTTELRVNGALQSTFSYDLAGNMLSGNGRDYEYDAQGQAKKITQGATTLEANYAADGRVWKITAGGVTRYRLTGDFEWNQTGALARTQVFLDGQILAITEDLFTPITYGGCGQVWPRNLPQPLGGELALLFVYGLAGALALPMLRAIRRRRPRSLRGWVSVGTSAVFLVAVSVPAGMLTPERAEAVSPLNTKYFHPDRLGSSLVVSDNTGAASARRVVYRPFGALVQNSGSTSSVPERGFTGQRFEASVGVYDYNARWYDPAIARFVQPDPLVRDAYDPQALGPFSYVANDPINRVDPTGLEPGVVGVSFSVTGSSGFLNRGDSWTVLLEHSESGFPRDLGLIYSREGDTSWGGILDGGFEAVAYNGEVEDWTDLDAIQVAWLVGGGSLLMNINPGKLSELVGGSYGFYPLKGGVGIFVDSGDPVSKDEFILSDYLVDKAFKELFDRLREARARRSTGDRPRSVTPAQARGIAADERRAEAALEAEIAAGSGISSYLHQGVIYIQGWFWDPGPPR